MIVIPMATGTIWIKRGMTNPNRPTDLPSCPRPISLQPPHPHREANGLGFTRPQPDDSNDGHGCPDSGLRFGYALEDEIAERVLSEAMRMIIDPVDERCVSEIEERHLLGEDLLNLVINCLTGGGITGGF